MMYPLIAIDDIPGTARQPSTFSAARCSSRTSMAHRAPSPTSAHISVDPSNNEVTTSCARGTAPPSIGPPGTASAAQHATG
jgi:hypothetical protein